MKKKRGNQFLRELIFIALMILCIFQLVDVLTFESEAQDVIFTTQVEIVQGDDGLFYSQCLLGCDEFYNVAPIDLLYRGQPTNWQAMNYYKQLEAGFLGLVFVPLPPPRTP